MPDPGALLGRPTVSACRLAANRYDISPNTTRTAYKLTIPSLFPSAGDLSILRLIRPRISPARLPPPLPLCNLIFLQPLLCLPSPHHSHPTHNAMASKPETCCGKSAECVCGMSCPYISPTQRWLAPLSFHSPPPSLQPSSCSVPLNPSEASPYPPPHTCNFSAPRGLFFG